MAQADIALVVRNNDRAATTLKSTAQTQLNAVLCSAQKYDQAIKAGHDALARQDYTKAMAQADIALGVRNNDRAAATLKSTAQAQLNAVLSAAQKYEQAIKAGNDALARQDYTNAMAQ